MLAQGTRSTHLAGAVFPKNDDPVAVISSSSSFGVLSALTHARTRRPVEPELFFCDDDITLVSWPSRS